MAIGDDFEVQANRNIRHVSGSTRYTVLQLYRWLQDLADDPTASGDDLVDILSPNVGIRRFDTIIELINGFNIDDTTAQYLYGGSITQADGAERYSGLAIVGSFPNIPPRVVQNNTKLSTFWNSEFSPDADTGTAVRILVKTTSGGTVIDGGRVRVQYRYYGDQYREASTVLGVGEAVAAPGNIQVDTFNDIASGTIVGAPYTTVSNTEGYQSIDLNNGSGNRPYYAQWDTGSSNKSGIYNRVKWLTRDGSVTQIYGMDGELFRGITHEIAISSPSGTFNSVEPVAWSTGTGQMLAIDSPTAGTKMWIQLLTGSTPSSDTISGVNSGATATTGTVTTRPLGVESVIGAFTGSILGAYGVGFDPNDLAVTDSLVDLNNVTQQPPNNVSIQVTGVVAGADYVLLGRDIGSGSINKTEFTLAAGNSTGIGTATINEAIPSDTPATGYIRLWNGSAYDRYRYTSWAGSAFNLEGTLTATYSTNAPAFVPFLDQLASGTTVSNSLVYSSSITVVGVVRSGTGISGGNPIVPFPLAGTISSTGFSVAAVRTSDA